MLATSSVKLNGTETFQEAFDKIHFVEPKVRTLYSEDGSDSKVRQILVNGSKRWSRPKLVKTDATGKIKNWNLDAKSKLNNSELFYSAFTTPVYAGADGTQSWLIGDIDSVDLLGEKYNVQGLIISNIFNPNPQYFISFERLVCENQFGSLGTTNSSIRINMSELLKQAGLTPEEAMKRYLALAVEERQMYMQKYLDKLLNIKMSDSKVDEMFRALTVDKARKQEGKRFEQYETNLENYRKAYNCDDNQNYKGTFLGFINSCTNFNSRNRANPISVVKPPLSPKVLASPVNFEYLCRDVLANAEKEVA